MELKNHYRDILMDLYITQYGWSHSEEYRQWANGAARVDAWLIHQGPLLPRSRPCGPTVVPQHSTAPATRLRSRSDGMSSSIGDPSVLNVSRRVVKSQTLAVWMAERAVG